MSELAVVSPWGRIEGAGSATGLSGTPAFDLKGMFSPDWQALTDLLARKVEPNASISGGPRAVAALGQGSQPGRKRRRCDSEWRAGGEP